MEAKVDEIAEGVYRISAYVPDIAPPAGFTYNHFLVVGDEPLLFHTGLRRMFPVVRAAVAKVLLWPLRGRRVRRDERMARRGAAR
jgi:flavorubredoxin